ncbi:MAG TPA: TonB family protein [Allosphingosinicella sp.]|jgi:protein TonB
MMRIGALRNEDRVKATAGVAALHVLLGYALVTGLGYQAVREAGENLKLINVAVEPPPPPPEKSVPDRDRSEAEEGAASPKSLKAAPTPVIAPPPKIVMPVKPPIRSAPKKTPVPEGQDVRAGVSTVPGPGTGTGGRGNGVGSGGSGTGAGGGGASRPVRLRGRIENDDYPASARSEQAEGSVAVVFTVERDGSVSGCRVARSSGRPDFDATTCRLIEARFLYKPATDAEGRAIQSVVRTVFTYDWQPRRRRRS